MAKFVGQVFEDQRVNVDNNSYQKCTFTHCELCYSGGTLPIFEEVTFGSCSYTFDDAAGRTVAMMVAMFRQDGMHRNMVLRTFGIDPEHYRLALSQLPLEAHAQSVLPPDTADQSVRLVIPARCPECNAVFQSRGFKFLVHSHSNVEFLKLKGCTENCIHPECRGRAQILEGDFRIANGAFQILKASDIDIHALTALGTIFEDLRTGRVTPEDAAEKIGQVAPTLRQWLSTQYNHPQFAVSILGILGVVVAAMIGADAAVKAARIGKDQQQIEEASRPKRPFPGPPAFKPIAPGPPMPKPDTSVVGRKEHSSADDLLKQHINPEVRGGDADPAQHGPGNEKDD